MDMTAITASDRTPSTTSETSTTTPIVFVVDGDLAVRESLELLIDAAGWQPETFAWADEFMAHPRALVPSCLILDVPQPGVSVLDLQKRLAVERPEMPIIFITEYGDVPMTVQAMRAGAFEVLTKPIDDDSLSSAVRQALDRSRSAIEQAAKMKALRDSFASLTTREREVMELVVWGLLNKQVGGELGISEITVKAHRGRMMRKMRAASLPALVTMGSRLGLPGAASRL